MEISMHDVAEGGNTTMMIEEAIIELKIALDAKGQGYGCISKNTLRMAIEAIEKED